MTFYRSVLPLALVLCLHSPMVSAADELTQRFRKLGFHAGSLTEFTNAVQVDDQGSTELFTFNPMLGFSLDIELTPEWTWVPEINWVLPRSAGKGITKNLFMLRNDAVWKGADWWRLRVGTSFMVNNIRGSGGTQVLNNGAGTSEFYVPGESRTAINNTLDLGAELVSDDVAVRFQTYVYSLLKSERRQLSYSLTLSYYHDLGN